MPQLEYWDVDDLPETPPTTLYADTTGQLWHLIAVVIHYTRDTHLECDRTAFLRRADGTRGHEWEIPMRLLEEMAVHHETHPPGAGPAGCAGGRRRTGRDRSGSRA
ncbi:hypothetical protein [Streptomyces capuensis]|uniref:hypothetical protein n=1 Tax=Streptomyces capuensis TaxID=1464056 RepID=UPI000A4707C5|nr:hypothetical protein [Streptomyces capuensis]